MNFKQIGEFFQFYQFNDQEMSYEEAKRVTIFSGRIFIASENMLVYKSEITSVANNLLFIIWTLASVPFCDVAIIHCSVALM